MTDVLIRKEIRTEITHRPRDDHREKVAIFKSKRENSEDTTPGQDLDHGF